MWKLTRVQRNLRCVFGLGGVGCHIISDQTSHVTAGKVSGLNIINKMEWQVDDIDWWQCVLFDYSVGHEVHNHNETEKAVVLVVDAIGLPVNICWLSVKQCGYSQMLCIELIIITKCVLLFKLVSVVQLLPPSLCWPSTSQWSQQGSWSHWVVVLTTVTSL